MQAQTYYIIAAVIMLGLIPLVPKMMNFRILVFRKLHLNWLANLHENHFRGFVIAVRIILAAMAVLLLLLAAGVIR